MAAKKKASSKKKKSTAVEGPLTHDDAMATMLSFANPPSVSDTEKIARLCVEQGLGTIGIPGPHTPDDEIDFGAIDEQSCVDFANSIEICVDSKGFEVPSLAGAFVLMHKKGTV